MALQAAVLAAVLCTASAQASIPQGAVAWCGGALPAALRLPAPSERARRRARRYMMSGGAFSGYDPKSGVWSSVVDSTKSVSVVGTPKVATDAAGAAGNTVPVSYMSGAVTDKLIFPEVYTSLAAMSICTVSRYTVGPQQRIFQPFKANINWLHGCGARSGCQAPRARPDASGRD